MRASTMQSTAVQKWVSIEGNEKVCGIPWNTLPPRTRRSAGNKKATLHQVADSSVF
jgi:hypothetical protein